MLALLNIRATNCLQSDSHTNGHPFFYLMDTHFSYILFIELLASVVVQSVFCLSIRESLGAGVGVGVWFSLFIIKFSPLLISLQFWVIH